MTREEMLDPQRDRKDDPADLEELLASYIDRLNAGEMLDENSLITEQPRLGAELWEQLEAFYQLGGDSPLEPPVRTLGDYTLCSEIGRGGGGVVYDAWENSMDRRVALKVLPAGVAADPRRVTRFVREAQLAGKLSHPNIVSVFGMAVKDETPCYAMELVEGETLNRIIASTGKTRAEASPFVIAGTPDAGLQHFAAVASAFAEVADGLQHAHAHGVIHRDIKPSNLILDGTGRLRILDFGLARIEGQDAVTNSGDLVGTPLYMSPEQARRRRIPIDHRTDVYSLGTTLYEVLTRRPPFKGKDYEETLSQIVEREPLEPRAWNPRIPADLETIILKCLRKAADDRFGTAEALAQDLRRFARSDPIEARPQSKWDKLGRRLWRRRVGIMTAGILFALAASTAFLAWRSYVDTRQEAFRRTVVNAVMKIEFGKLGLDEVWGKPTPTGWSLLHVDLTPRLRDSTPNPLELARDDLTAAMESHGETPATLYHRARALLLLGRDGEARADLDRALAVEPGFLPAIALEQALVGDERSIDEWLRSGCLPGGVQENRWAGVWLRAFVAARAEDWENAARAYDRLAFRNVQGEEIYLGASIENLLGLGVARFKSGDIEGAANVFASLRDLWRGFLEPELLLGTCYLQSGRADLAEATFRDLFGVQMFVSPSFSSRYSTGRKWAHFGSEEPQAARTS